MRDVLTIVTDVRGVCLSVSLSRSLTRRQCVQCMLHAMCAGSFGEAFAKCLWPLVIVLNVTRNDVRHISATVDKK